MSKESDDKLAGEIVAMMRGVFGRHKARAAHAKGIVLQGRFAATEEACTLSEAAVFSEPSLPITVRFSDFTGLPDIADTDDNANPRGMAVRFHAGPNGANGGNNLDIVAHSFNGFPSASAQDFAELMRALAASPPDAAKPTALDTYLASHPPAATFFTTQKPPPVSFATAAYFGVNAVTFDDGAGKRTHVRHRFVPQAGEHYLDAATRATLGPNYLREEIARRLAGGPVAFDWQVQLAEPGDRLDDPSTAWPENRRRITVGMLAIERVAADQAAADKILFGPGLLPLGIEAADPMLKIRDTAYFISSKDR
jgi:catalase